MHKTKVHERILSIKKNSSRLILGSVAVTVSFVFALSSLGYAVANADSSTVSNIYRWGVPEPSSGGVQQGQDYDTPTAVSGIPNPVVQIVTSNSDDYALDNTGAVWVWGAGTNGEFGNGTKVKFDSTPQEVTFPAGVTIASLPSPMPFNTSLAIDTNGNVWGWGYNSFSQLCLSNTSILKPRELPLSNVTMASGAGDHTIFDENGSLVACGSNGNGDLGDGNTNKSATPQAVVGLPNEAIQSVTTSWRNSGVVMSDGTYYNWGFNSDGELGNGKGKASDVPVQVKLQAAVADASEGGSYGGNGQTIVLLSDGTVWSWGTNKNGQLGNGKTTNSAYPIQVDVPSGVTFTQVVSGGASDYAIDSNNQVYSWGQNNYGQLGNGQESSGSVTLPVVIGLTATQISSTASNVEAAD
jgi:alpha-tubulin suppressor-like RCC1 family protein